MSKARDLADSYTDNEIDSDVINAKAGRKNLIINGGFDVWQRGTSFTANNFTADRFSLHNAGLNITLSRTTLVPANKGFKYSAQCSGTAADPYFQQRIEGSQAVAGREATFSFWINGTLSDLAVPAGYIYDGTYNSLSTLGASLIETVGTWNRYSVTHTFATGDYNPIVRLDFAEDVATTIQTTGWQLELGSQATDFEYRSYGEELALCQRYYQNLHFTTHPVNTYISSLYSYTSFPLVKEMRVIPTVIFDTSVANGGFVHNRNAANSITNAIPATTFSKSCVNAAFIVSGGFGGDAGHVYVGIKADAEL